MIGLGGLLLSVLTVALSQSWWVFDLTTHFRPHYVTAALLLALLALILGRRRLALLAVVLAFPHLVTLDSLVRVESARAAAPGGSGQSLTLLTANLLRGNRERAASVEQILALNPDVVVLQEGVGSWRSDLEKLIPRYPYRSPVELSQEDRVHLFSRVPLRGVQVFFPVGRRYPYLYAELDLDGQAMHLLALHAPLPMSGSLSRLRNDYLRALARHAAALEGPVVMAGDFNITPWSPYFLDLVADSGLRDSAQGRGWLPTWPTWLPLAGIPIDHVLVSPEVTVSELTRARPAGSDHYPLIAELTIR